MQERNEKACSIEKCDIFDFMANYAGLSVLHPGGFKATKTLAEACQINKDTHVLDVACGKGTSSIYLAQEYGCRVTGIDLSEDLIDYANRLARGKRLQDRVSFRTADALVLPFSNDEFDVSISQAMLVLLDDKKKSIQESIRVTKPDGYMGWVELSWREEPPPEFMDDVSNVICAYCMLNVHTFQDWEKLFKDAGVKELLTMKYPMTFQGMRSMITDEGLNAVRVMFRVMTRHRVRKRMNTMNRFFKDNAQYFGYGIYIGRK